MKSAKENEEEKMNLIIDIGNSTAKVACFDKERLVSCQVMPNDNLENLTSFLSEHPCSRGIFSSVIDVTEKVSRQLNALPFPLLHFSTSTPIPVKNLYRTPGTLGTDRLAAVVAAAIRFPQETVLVIDAGTCVTYELVSAKGEYLGGNISLGMHMRLQALHHYTGKLPLVEEQGEQPLMGYDTDTAIRSGVKRGIQYEIEGYIHELQKKYPTLLVLLTGGDRFDFDSQLKNIIFADKFLVLRGLNYILHYNEP